MKIFHQSITITASKSKTEKLSELLHHLNIKTRFMKHKQLFISALLFTFYLHGYSQVILKQQSDVGGSYGEIFQKICLSTDGGFLVAGSSESNKSRYKTESSRGDLDYWLVKYDSLGQIKWDKTIGGDGSDYLTIALRTNDGGYFLCGNSASGISGERTAPNIGQSDCWMVKIDADGNILWDKAIGTIYSDYAAYADNTKGGGYILLTSMGLIKVDSLGNTEWQNQNLTTGSGYTSVKTTKDGSYILSSFETVFEEGRLFFYPVLTKTDRLGNELGKKVYTTGPRLFNTPFYKVILTKDGGTLLYGLGKTDSSKYDQSAADFIKTDKQGNIVWRYTSKVDSFYLQASLEAKELPGGGYIYGGTYQPEDVSGGRPDYILGRLDSNGNELWHQLISGSSDDEFSDIVILKPGKYIVGGNSDSPQELDKTKPNLGNQDYWTLYVSDTTHIKNSIRSTIITSVQSKGKSGFHVYPNPAKDIIHLEVSDKAAVTMTDANGKTVFAKTITGRDEISVSGFAPGYYFVKNLTTGETRKILIAK